MFVRALQPKFNISSRVTVAKNCWDVYTEEKSKLKRVLKSQRVCLTTDAWTSVQNLNYMCLTAYCQIGMGQIGMGPKRVGSSTDIFEIFLSASVLDPSVLTGHKSIRIRS
jgi:hypothetical protein